MNICTFLMTSAVPRLYTADGGTVLCRCVLPGTLCVGCWWHRSLSALATSARLGPSLRYRAAVALPQRCACSIGGPRRAGARRPRPVYIAIYRTFGLRVKRRCAFSGCAIISTSSFGNSNSDENDVHPNCYIESMQHAHPAISPDRFFLVQPG